MPYAVNLAALTSVRVREDFILQMLLKQVIDLEPGHEIQCMPDKVAAIGVGVPFTCDEERAEAIVRVIRQRYRHEELPIYYSKTGRSGWRYSRVGRERRGSDGRRADTD
jgi:hypothetical protein